MPAQTIASSCSRSSALSFTTYFLTEISLPATNYLHRRIAETEIKKNTTDLMTLATRPWRWTCAVAAYALGVSRAAMDFAWARLGEIGVVLDYNATIMQCSAAVDRMFALKAEWEAT